MNVLDTLEMLKEGISQVLINLLEFMQNKLKGKVRPEFKIGDTIPHRQEMVAKVGILKALFELLELIANNFDETEESAQHLESLLKISWEDFSGNENMIEVLVKTIRVITMNNKTNVVQALQYIDVIQKFLFVEGCTNLLVDVFKDKNFELNKKEIHTEFLYRRIFEINKFAKALKYLINRVSESRDPDSILLLRKICIIDGNPLPLVQNAILEQLYHSRKFSTRFIIKSTKNYTGLEILDDFEDSDLPEQMSVGEFMQLADADDKLFLYEQLTMEADMCYGRNRTTKSYFRECYTCSWLIEHIRNNDLHQEIRAKFIRILTFLYIDDDPHYSPKMSRVFQGYESSNKLIEKVSQF